MEGDGGGDDKGGDGGGDDLSCDVRGLLESVFAQASMGALGWSNDRFSANGVKVRMGGAIGIASGAVKVNLHFNANSENDVDDVPQSLPSSTSVSADASDASEAHSSLLQACMMLVSCRLNQKSRTKS